MAVDSSGEVPDLTDRVVRVSFAPAGEASSNPVPDVSDGPGDSETQDQISVSALSIGELQTTVNTMKLFTTVNTIY